jgi:hypothetical protein
MSRTPPKFTQADISRAIRAAIAAGAAAVLLQPDGTIRIELKTGVSTVESNDRKEIIL